MPGSGQVRGIVYWGALAQTWAKPMPQRVRLLPGQRQPRGKPWLRILLLTADLLYPDSLELGVQLLQPDG